jgi:hypothetical protein
MDEKLRNLERLAMADPAALPEYLAALLRTGFSRQIEGKARLGDPGLGIKIYHRAQI